MQKVELRTIAPLLAAFDREFGVIDRRSRELLMRIDEENLFEQPVKPKDSMLPTSCGEYILRSAGMVEKTFGGITTRLWDDPFEWTLPEELATTAAVSQYLDEVEATRKKDFYFLDRMQISIGEIPAPEHLRPIFEILLDALLLATHYQGRAFAILQILSDAKLPRL